MKFPLPLGYEQHALKVLQHYADNEDSLVDIIEVVRVIEGSNKIDMKDAWHLDRMIHTYLVSKDLIDIEDTPSGFRTYHIRLKGLWVLAMANRNDRR